MTLSFIDSDVSQRAQTPDPALFTIHNGASSPRIFLYDDLDYLQWLFAQLICCFGIALCLDSFYGREILRKWYGKMLAITNAVDGITNRVHQASCLAGLNNSSTTRTSVLSNNSGERAAQEIRI